MDLSLEGLDGVPVLFTDIVLDVFAEDDDRVIVLFHAALRTLDARLEPGRDALVVEDVLALELLVRALGQLKTDCTCV